MKVNILGRAIAAAVVACSGLGWGSSAPSSAAAADSDAISALGACLASGARGDVLLVLDTSASLKETDPDDQRVAAASYLVRQLADYSERSGASIDVAVAGFADRFALNTSWTPLDAGSVDDLVVGVEEFATKDGGFETDYWQAASGAREALTRRQTGEQRHCQAWIWLSDGMLDLDKRDSAEEQDTYGTSKPYGPDVELVDDSAEKRLEDAAASDLCRRGGVSDQLRSQQVLTLAVGLDAGSASDFGLMRGIATGSDSCGRPVDRPVGQFVLAENMREVLLAFDALSDPDHAPVTQTAPTCRGTVCEEGAHQFVLDGSITQVHVVGGTDVAADLVLTPPGSKPFRIAQGADSSRSLTGADLDFSWISEDVVEFDLTRLRDKGWVGRWVISFVTAPGADSGTATSNIHLYGDVRPAVLDPDALDLVVGASTEIGLGLVHAADDRPIDPASLRGTVSLDATLLMPDGSAVPLAEGLGRDQLGDEIRVDLSGAQPGDAVIRLELGLTTAGTGGLPGTALEPQAVDVPVEIQAPPSYPTVPGKVSFGTVDATDPVTASLALDGDGCAWLEESEALTLPEGVSDAAVTSGADSQNGCAEGDLKLTLTPDGTGNGLASGDLTVLTLPADGAGDPVAMHVGYELEMKRPRNNTVFGAALVGIMLAGILLPLALLYAVKWRTAQIPGLSVLVGSLTGHVGKHSADFLAVGLAAQQMRGVTLAGSRKRVVIGAGAELRTRMGLGPTETGYVAVTGPPSVASARPGTTRRGRTGRLPLPVQDHWVAVLDARDPHNGPVEVVFLLGPSSTRLSELVADARNRVPELVTKVRSRLGSPTEDASTAVPTSDDWGNPVSPASTAGQGGTSPAGQQPPSSQQGWDEW